MIRIDFGTLFEFEQEDKKRKKENRQKIADFLTLCETHQATVVEQRDWHTRDLVHFVGISTYLVFTITISDQYLAIQTSQIREKFKTFQCDYVSIPDRLAVSLEQPPIEKMDLHEIVACPNCAKKTPYDGYMQHCVHCGDKMDTVIKTCTSCNNHVGYHPSFNFCPSCGTELQPQMYEGPPLNELDPNSLIWGIPLGEPSPDEDPFSGGPSLS